MAESQLPPSAWTNSATRDIASRDDLLALYVNDVAENACHHVARDREFGLRIATYNAHHWTSPLGEINVDDHFRALAALDADIVLLQEAIVAFSRDRGTGCCLRVCESDDLIERLGYEYSLVAPTSRDLGREGSVCVGNVMLSRIPMIESAGYVLPDPRELRTLAYARVLAPGGSVLDVYTTHLDVWDPTDEVRQAQINAVLEIVASRKQHESVPAILAGDLNSICGGSYSDSELAWLRRNNRGEPLALRVPEILRCAGWYDEFNENPLKWTTWSARAVDHVWTFRLGGRRLARVHYVTASDHLPLTLDVPPRAQ